jgi:methylmalonyl-CoA mutase
MTVHARTSAWTKTVLDPNVNLLRATTEAFSAIVGGVDSLHVSAFDEAIRPANDFSRRIARNTQIILEQEAHLAKVVDPAGGSWYVEWLTDAIAQKAWELFQQVEEQGGMIRALESGYPQEQIEQMAKKKADDISHRKSRVVGTNMYANVQEQPVQAETLPRIQEEQFASLQAHRGMQDPVLVTEAIHQLAIANGSEQVLEKAVKAALAGATLGDLTKAIVHSNQEPVTVQPLHLHRGAEIFESLRKQADLYREKTGSSPKVFLANMGPVSKHKARADFTTEFFAVGGFDVVRDQSFASAEEAAQAAIDSGAAITVICSDDDSYPELVPPLARVLKDNNQQMTVLLAGLPAADRADEYKTAGVDDFIHVRANCYQMLRDLQKRIGVLS